MQYITFDEPGDYKIAILSYDLDYPGMLKNYIEKGFIAEGADPEIRQQILAYNLPFEVSGKKRKKKAPSAGERREYLTELLEVLDEAGVNHILVANPDYYKTLTGAAKAAAEVGGLVDPDKTHFGSFTHMRVGYIPNHKMAFYNPEDTFKGIKLACRAVLDDQNQVYKVPGSDVLRKFYIPVTDEEILESLKWLLAKPGLATDIEAFSLHHHDAGIHTISFAWSPHEVIGFKVDHAPNYENTNVRAMLWNFFRQRHLRAKSRSQSIKNVFHNAGYDATVLIHQLSKYRPPVNKSVGRYDNMFDWLCDPETLEDTKIISYLATNSTAGNKLGLKEQAVEFAGNYAVDVKDVTKVPLEELLIYNMIDSCSTAYVYEKHYGRMIQDQQLEVYKEIFLPSLCDVIDMQLTGLPVDMEEVKKAKAAITQIRDQALGIIQATTMVVDYTHHLKEEEAAKRNAKYKKKRITASDVDFTFNPNSDSQLAGLLYGDNFFGLPILGTTDSGAPSTKGTYIKSLKSHTESTMVKQLLDAIIDLKDASILLSTFIPALEDARWNSELKWHFMHGNFNLGGTVSGRLSSSDPNLQNLPSKSRLAKYIKYCIRAAPGWLFVGLDFDSLEDKISALLTKDPNKLKVYTDGYDGHSLRAFSYFGAKMAGIDGALVESINSIRSKYPDLRQLSKTPTFLLTYGGTHHGLIEQCGFNLETAISIEENYHTLYRVSDEFVANELETARSRGYIEVAFGLRVRTPILGQTVDTQRHTPYAAKAEGRTAGNALGQSWNLLNNRACSEVMNLVRERRSNSMRAHIKVCCQIHDAQYYMIKADPDVLLWLNSKLSRAVQWQDHPAIAHDQVKLSGELSIFYPSWAEEYPIPNAADYGTLSEIDKKIIEDMNS